MLLRNTIKSFARPRAERTTASGKSFKPIEAYEIGQLGQLKQSIDQALSSGNNSYTLSINPYNKSNEQRYAIEFRFWTAKPIKAAA